MLCVFLHTDTYTEQNELNLKENKLLGEKIKPKVSFGKAVYVFKSFSVPIFFPWFGFPRQITSLITCCNLGPSG